MTTIAVLDANVLIPNALCDFLLRLAEEELYQPRWSPAILEEVRRRFPTTSAAPPSTATPRFAMPSASCCTGAKRTGVAAIAIEDLDFQTEKTREKHGRKRRFRQLISGIPTGKLKARLVSMAVETGLSIVAVDPAYTSQWGAQHWHKPMTAPRRTTTRHDAASIAIARRALGHPIRRRTAPPRARQSDVHGHRTIQAGSGFRGREETRRLVTDRGHEPPARMRNNQRTRATSAPKTVRDARSDGQ